MARLAVSVRGARPSAAVAIVRFCGTSSNALRRAGFARPAGPVRRGNTSPGAVFAELRPQRGLRQPAGTPGALMRERQEKTTDATDSVQLFPLVTESERKASSIPLLFRNNRLESEAGLVVFEDANEGFFTSKEQDKAVVLGFQTSDKRSQIDEPLGQLRCNRLLCCGRNKLWWMTPEWGSKAKDIPPETQFLLTEIEEGGPYAIILPLINDNQFRCTLRPPQSGGEDTLWIRMESNSEDVATTKIENTVLIQASWDLYSLVNQGVAMAAQLSGGSKPLAEKTLPPSLDVFGWCTWDAFYSKVSAKGIREGLSSLVKGGVPPRLLVIDDGWQQTDVDADQKAMFGDKNIIAEEVWEAERLAMQSTSIDLATRDAGTSAAAATVTLTAEDEDEARERKELYAQYRREVSAMPHNPEEMKPWFAKVQSGVWHLLDAAIGWGLGLGQAAFLRFYEKVVEPAPPGSRPVKFFTWMANGPLRAAMVQFYNASGDFTERLVDFGANSKFSTPFAGPTTKGVAGNLGAVVQSLRSDFGLDYVYCWHGLPGYWGGLSPDSPATNSLSVRVLTSKPTPGVLEVEPSMGWGPTALAGVGCVEDQEQLFENIHSYLAREGIDGVKVDVQAGVGLIPCSEGTPSKSAKYQYALEESVKKHFPGNHIINCMCHCSENFYRFKDSAVARACDDFYPRDRASHTTHIANSAYNSLFLGALVMPDWDMFQSKHSANLLHAAARAVSGGAVYVSDAPGRHDFDLLRRLVLPDGSVLRAQLPGRPTADSVFVDPMRDGKSLLKVWNHNLYSAMVGVFHVQGSSWDRTMRKFHIHDKKPAALEARATVRDAEMQSPSGGQEDGEQEEARYVAFCSISKHMERVTGQKGGVTVSLANGEAEVVTFARLQRFGDVEFAPIGLTDMLNPGGAVFSCSGSSSSRTAMSVVFHGCGRFTAAANRAPTSCLLDGKEIGFVFDGERGAITVDMPLVDNLAGELVFNF